MTKAVNSREVVLEILTDVLESDKFSHIVVRETLKKYKDFDKTNRGFITKISEGTIENLIKIDYVIDQFSKVKTEKMKPFIRNLLRMSVYQLLYLDSVPDSAVCNEAVKIAEKHGFIPLKGFVNGVLRNIARNLETIEYPNGKTDMIRAYSVQYSMPEWILRLWFEDYGKETLEIILNGFREYRPLSVRCNHSKISKKEIIASLTAQNITVKQSSLLDEALFLSDYDNIDSIEAHQKGYILVQDISSMLVGRAAFPKRGNTVIDVCAAPGGKSIHIADLLNGTGRVEARDISEYKINLIKENIERTGFKNIEAQIKDAAVFDSDSEAKADILIADLPCSGLGVLNKKTDLKYKVQPESLNELALLQRKILKQVQSYVKPGGALIFSTCTINKKENEENMEWFIKNFPFQLESLNDNIPTGFWNETSDKGYIQLYPGVKETDGFFIARFRRNE